MFVPRYTEAEARRRSRHREATAQVLRVLDLCPTGGNTADAKRWAMAMGDLNRAFRGDGRQRSLHRVRRKPLEEILVEGSTYARANLKARL